MTDKKSPGERVADLFFYAPLGFLLGLDEVMPELIQRGRSQVTAARMFGELAVRQGQSEAVKVLDQLGKLAGWTGTDDGRTSPAPAAPPAPSTPPAATGTEPAPPAPTQTADVGDRVRRDGPDAASLAIPDYDSLAASQVVPRLEGLSTDELEAVRAYEAARRGRKTILNKVAQLQQPSAAG